MTNRTWIFIVIVLWILSGYFIFWKADHGGLVGGDAGFLGWGGIAPILGPFSHFILLCARRQNTHKKGNSGG